MRAALVALMFFNGADCFPGTIRYARFKKGSKGNLKMKVARRVCCKSNNREAVILERSEGSQNR